MALVDSLLTAMVRANGDALVMHVGEKPYVVTEAGPIDLSNRVLNLQAMTAMLAQLIPADAQSALSEFGAVEHRLPSMGAYTFTMVAARGGDDIWIEIRRRLPKTAASAKSDAPPASAAATAPVAQVPQADAASTSPPHAIQAAGPVEPLAAAAPAPALTAEPPAVEVPAVPAVEVAPVAIAAPIVSPAPEPTVPPEPIAVAKHEPVAVPPVHAVPAATSEPDVVTQARAVDVEAIEPVALPKAEPIAILPPEPTPVPLPEPIAVSSVEPTPAPPAEDRVVPDAEPVEVPGVDAVATRPPDFETVTSEPVEMPGEPQIAAMAAAPVVRQPEPVVVPKAEPMVAPRSEPTAAPVAEPLEIPVPVRVVTPAPVVTIQEPAIAAIAASSAQPVLEAPPAAVVDKRIETPAVETPAAPAPKHDRPAPVLTPAASTTPPPELRPARPMQEAPAAQAEPHEAVVLPMTRTVRIEVPARALAARQSVVERLLRLAAARGASALFLSAPSRPYVRVDGDMRALDGEPPLGSSDVEAAVFEVIPEAARESVRRGDPTEWIAEIADLGRIRCTSFRDHHGPGVLFRMISTRAATAEQLGLAREVEALATEAEGLVLVAGPRGSGKSTLVSAFVDLINRQRADYVITLERQLRLLHDNRAALISQREIRGNAEEMLAAARAALRENPDVFVVEDLISAEMLPLVLDAAGQGLLVIVSMTVPSTIEAVQRLVDLAPPDRRASVHATLAETFRGAVAQVLLRKTGGGRVAARELLLGTGPVTRLIADGQLDELPLALESGRRHGMVPLTDTLVALVQSGAVDVREAYRKAADRERLLAGLRREGIDTSCVERLA